MLNCQNQRLTKTDTVREVLMCKLSSEASVVPQMFLPVVWPLMQPSVYPPALVYVSPSLFSLSTSSNTQIHFSGDTEHKLKHTSCLSDEWIRREAEGRRYRKGKGQAVMWIKPPSVWPWRVLLLIFKGGLVTDLRWLAGWRNMSCVCEAGGGGGSRCYVS